MVVFGGKFCARETVLGDQIACNCSEIADPFSGCECLRWNFDSFLDAALTVFVVSAVFNIMVLVNVCDMVHNGWAVWMVMLCMVRFGGKAWYGINSIIV